MVLLQPRWTVGSFNYVINQRCVLCEETGSGWQYNWGSLEHPSFIVLDPTVQSNYAIQFRLFPMVINMSHSWAVNNLSTIQLAMTDVHQPLSLSLSVFCALICSPFYHLLCSLQQKCSLTHTSTHSLSHTDIWSVTPLAFRPERNTEGTDKICQRGYENTESSSPL